MHAYADKQTRALVVFLCVILAKLPALSLCVQEETGSEDAREANDQIPERYGGMTDRHGQYVPTATEIFGDSKTTLLVQALWRGDSKAARELIASGVDVNAGGRRGVTPLQFLVKYEKIEGVELALELGADPNQSSDGGDTPLYYASRAANWRTLLKTLVNAGANVQKASKAARLKTPSFTIEHRIMLKLMADKRAADPGEEALPSTTAERPGFDPLWWLLEHGGDVNARDALGDLLWSAYVMRYPDIAYALLERGANPFVREAGHRSPAELLPEVPLKPRNELDALWMERVKKKVESLDGNQEMIRQAREIEASYAKFYERYRRTEGGALRERMMGELDGIVDALEEEVEDAEECGD